MNRVESPLELPSFLPDPAVREAVLDPDGTACVAVLRDRSGADHVAVLNADGPRRVGLLGQAGESAAGRLIRGSGGHGPFTVRHGDGVHVRRVDAAHARWHGHLRLDGSVTHVGWGQCPVSADGRLALAVTSRDARSSTLICVRSSGDVDIVWDRGGHLLPELWMEDELVCSSHIGRRRRRLYLIDRAGRVRAFSRELEPATMDIVGWDPAGDRLVVIGTFEGDHRAIFGIPVGGTPHLMYASPDRDVANAHVSGSRLALTVDVGDSTESRLVERDDGTETTIGQPGMVRSIELSRGGDRILMKEEGPDEPYRLALIDLGEGGAHEPVPIHRPSLTARGRGVLLRPDSQRVVSVPCLVYRRPDATRSALVVLHGGPGVRWRRDYALGGLVQFLAHRGVALYLAEPGDPGADGATDPAGWWSGPLGRLRGLIGGLTDAYDRVALLGWSLGGTMALLAAADGHPGLTACAAVGAPVDVAATSAHLQAGSRGPRDQVFPPSSGGDRTTSPADLVTRYRIPLLLVHGDHDELVPVGTALAFRDAIRAAGGHVSWLSLPTGHALDGPGAGPQVQAALASFFLEHLTVLVEAEQP